MSDWDGTATQRGKATIVGSGTGSTSDWWYLDDKCQKEPSSGAWMCDRLPWRTVARLDVHIDGYTAVVNTNAGLSPSPENQAGYVSQFGYSGSSKRSTIITRNEGITGVTGTGGWYIHFTEGAPSYMQVYLKQVPPGTSIIFATRYPPGTAFSIRRVFTW
eukprot:320552-Chlamydomonas_euryale.AAC.31